MPSSRLRWAAEPSEHLTIAVQGALTESITPHLAAGAFFLGWVAVGVGAGLVLVARGHDPRLMVPLGAGLGPLMLALAPDVAASEAEAQPVALAAGDDRGGALDVLILIQDDPEHVLTTVPNLEAVAPLLGLLTIGRAVPYEHLEAGPEDDALAGTCCLLLAARDLLGRPDAALIAYPGTAEDVARSFCARSGSTLVLFAAGVRACDGDE